jgi:hypothetical protein
MKLEDHNRMRARLSLFWYYVSHTVEFPNIWELPLKRRTTHAILKALKAWYCPAKCDARVVDCPCCMPIDLKRQ